MYRYFLLIVVFVLGGCASSNVVQFLQKPLNSNKLLISESLKLYEYAQLADISYRDSPEVSAQVYKELGFDVSYYTISKPLLGSYPELFILSMKGSPNVIIVFKGTDSWFDWYQNFKQMVFLDKKKDGDVYIPMGPAGFRSGVLNLVNFDFHKFGIKKHIDTFGLPESLSLTLIGHSQGGALSQLTTPYLDGMRYKNNAVIRSHDWKHSVKKVITFGTPLALHKEKNNWDFMNKYYGHKTMHVIRDGDIVSTAYIPKKKQKLYRLYGSFIRIDRDGNAHLEETSWGKDDASSSEPHAIKNYESALRRAQY